MAAADKEVIDRQAVSNSEGTRIGIDRAGAAAVSDVQGIAGEGSAGIDLV